MGGRNVLRLAQNPATEAPSTPAFTCARGLSYFRIW